MTKNYGISRNNKKKPVKRRSSKNKEHTPDKSTLTLIKVFICIFAVIVMLIIKLMFPETMDSISVSVKNWVSGDVDYKSALSTMGEAMMGKKNVFKALPEAYSYAFGIVEEETPPTIDLNNDNNTDSKETIIEIEEETQTTPIFTQKPNDRHEPQKETNTKIEEFLESQSPYSAYELPEKVSYDMPEILDSLCLPALGPVTSEYGFRTHPVENEILFHYGTDIGAEYGSEIYSVADGKVIATGDSTGYGNYLLIEHSNGLQSQYSHCKEILVHEGESVEKGDVIARIGDTGNATSACLHFELLIDGIYVNPEFYLTWN